MANKLELTWYGKSDTLNVEPRILIENQELSNIEVDSETENVLIHGDNLLALKALEKKYSKQIKCIYIDPPYNIDAANEHYDDLIEHSMWLDLMRKRLAILRSLLAKEGSIWIQIDDEEMAYLKVLCDEVFGRQNFVNTISVNMKNTAGVSGGGEDKRLKKNCEYILVYARDYQSLQRFKNIYEYTEMYEYVQSYKASGKTWHYTSVLVNEGQKIYVGSTVDGDGNEIKIFKRVGVEIYSINQLMRRDNISEKEVYYKYGKYIFEAKDAQSSIRQRVKDAKSEYDIQDDVISIEYVPKTGKNKGTLYEQFYKGDSCRLFAWLRDISEEINGVLYKTDLQGTYWNMTSAMNNVSKEGSVLFPNSKKPEKLLSQIIEMCTDENDYVLDSFLGSGTTMAVAHKMKRRWIGIEMGEHAYTHCKKRIDAIIDGNDEKGVTEQYSWNGGGGYRFYEIAPTLIKKDDFDEFIINPEYDADMLASAVAIHEGYTFCPDENVFWKQSRGTENSYLFTTTRHINDAYIDSIYGTMDENDFLIIACRSYDTSTEKKYPNIMIKKIPQMLLDKCEFDKDNYNLNIINPPVYVENEEDEFYE